MIYPILFHTSCKELLDSLLIAIMNSYDDYIIYRQYISSLIVIFSKCIPSYREEGMSTTITCEGIETVPDNVSPSTSNHTNHSHGAPSVSSVLPDPYVQRQLPSQANRAASASPNTFNQ